jgi:hypothetical protein
MAEQGGKPSKPRGQNGGSKWSTDAVADHLVRTFGDGLLAGRK